jgi:mRNA deadenylase 3'-5' endonuclease subunit Ccr4
MGFMIATYNVLATAYLKPDWYPLSPPELLDPLHRTPALVEHMVRFRADILCLQEVEPTVYAVIDRRLSPLGYAGSFALKGQNKPDGCATFVLTRAFERVRSVRVEYHDAGAGSPDSGHVAQIHVLRDGQRFLGIANTHLKWDTPSLSLEERYGYRQLIQLLQECRRHGSECTGWAICGDFNVTPDNSLVGVLHKAGFQFSHVNYRRAATCNAHRRAKMLDFVFYSTALHAEPVALPAVRDETPLPGPDQPSDHVAVLTKFEWGQAERANT